MKNILLIPGHGGKDPGAIAADLREADLTLEVALKTATHLREKFHIFLSRDKESQYISPSEQLKMINDINSKVKLDAAIAIHFNASDNSQAHGIETIYRDDNDYMLAAIIHRNLLADIDEADRGCKEDERTLAIFKALPEIPVCLVELGFITNPKDHLFIETHIDLIADSLARAIEEAMA